MSRKQIGSLVGAVLLAAIAPLFVLALLHSAGGTAQADAPPATYTKVSMPDLGQHSTGWCWVAAAANSFWWYADNVPGQQGLLGSIDKPWKAIDAASTNPGSLCGVGGTWYDSRDAPVQPPPAPPSDGSMVAGYPTVLKKIAETTFRDANQDGIKQAGEQNYCYSEGVEKWNYLIGLRDYVNNYGSSLVVHDIIDGLRCGKNTGLIVNRTTPTMNSLDPCGKTGPPYVPGVPGVTQVVKVGGPTFSDYQTELSRSQDVLLWMEIHETGLETAHVVTGVGYDANVGAGHFGMGTVTISDPWTHTTNAAFVPPPPPNHPSNPSAWHNDFLLPPWQSKPDHNTLPNHDPEDPGPITDPYNLCDVFQLVPSFQIQCYDEDTGAPHVWQVVDMIFVSPALGVGGLAELPDASGSSGANNVLLAGLASAGVAAVIAGAWYARRRWQR
jgi:hypothetical protein